MRGEKGEAQSAFERSVRAVSVIDNKNNDRCIVIEQLSQGTAKSK